MNKILKIKNFKMGLLAVGMLLSCLSAPARAAFTVGDISALTTAGVTDLVKTIGTGTDFNGYRPANSLGMLLGLELGGELTMVQIPTAFGTALSQLGNTATVPSLFPATRIHLWKGLPLGIDVGGTWLSISGVTIWSAMVQKSIIEAPGLALGGRVSYNSTKVDFISTNSFDVEAVASTGLGIIFPYVSAGIQFVSGRLDFTGFSPSGATAVSLNASATAFRIALGVDLKLGFIHLVPQYTINMGGAGSFGAKAAISF